MKVFIVTCFFNVSQTLIDCAFKSWAVAETYVADLNADKEKAAARCKELIALREGEAEVKYLVEGSPVSFEIVTAELK